MVWQPLAILPNLRAGRTIDGGYVAFAGDDDPRIQELCRTSPQFADLLDRFTDAFEVPIRPMVLIVMGDLNPPVSRDALLSFRDLVAVSVVTYGRILHSVYEGTNRIMWSTSFTFHPWTISTDSQHLTTSTPALSGLHLVSAFRGQALPEVPEMEIEDIDEPLFEALLNRWKEYYFGNRKTWENRALFRSLNMAFYAAAIPSAVGTTLFDLGRSVALWVSALETLSHPGDGPAGVETVYRLFDRLTYIDRNVGRRRYAAYAKKGKKGTKPKRRELPCWVYGKLYDARNKFLHGNRVSEKILEPGGGRQGLFWLAAPLYRLALSGSLGLEFDRATMPYWLSSEYQRRPRLRKMRAIYDHQHLAERALLRIKK